MSDRYAKLMSGYELSETELRRLYGTLVKEAIEAFSIDLNYATEICLKARSIEDRKARRIQS